MAWITDGVDAAPDPDTLDRTRRTAAASAWRHLSAPLLSNRMARHRGVHRRALPVRSASGALAKTGAWKEVALVFAS